MDAQQWALKVQNRKRGLEEVLQLLDSRLKERGKKGGTRVQKRKNA